MLLRPSLSSSAQPLGGVGMEKGTVCAFCGTELENEAHIVAGKLSCGECKDKSVEEGLSYDGWRTGLQTNGEIDANLTPMMEPEEIKFLEKLFLFSNAMYVLEWGVGGSTIYFPEFLPKLNEWFAVEHNKWWATTIYAVVCEKYPHQMHFHFSNER